MLTNWLSGVLTSLLTGVNWLSGVLTNWLSG